jgi:ML-like domain
MKSPWSLSSYLWTLTLLASLPARVLSGDILQTTGVSTCGPDADIRVNQMNITFDRATRQVSFNVGGTSTKQQAVTASLVVYAYGQQVYQKSFDPCSNATYVAQLCPGQIEHDPVPRIAH